MLFFRFGLASSVLPGSNPQAVIRHLPIDMSLILWQVVFSQREPAILAKWLSFHETVQPVRGITEDTWDLFLPFALSVRYLKWCVLLSVTWSHLYPLSLNPIKVWPFRLWRERSLAVTFRRFCGAWERPSQPELRNGGRQERLSVQQQAARSRQQPIRRLWVTTTRWGHWHL